MTKTRDQIKNYLNEDEKNGNCVHLNKLFREGHRDCILFGDSDDSRSLQTYKINSINLCNQLLSEISYDVKLQSYQLTSKHELEEWHYINNQYSDMQKEILLRALVNNLGFTNYTNYDAKRDLSSNGNCIEFLKIMNSKPIYIGVNFNQDYINTTMYDCINQTQKNGMLKGSDCIKAAQRESIELNAPKHTIQNIKDLLDKTSIYYGDTVNIECKNEYYILGKSKTTAHFLHKIQNELKKIDIRSDLKKVHHLFHHSIPYLLIDNDNDTVYKALRHKLQSMLETEYMQRLRKEFGERTYEESICRAEHDEWIKHYNKYKDGQDHWMQPNNTYP